VQVGGGHELWDERWELRDGSDNSVILPGAYALAKPLSK
jgi:hypothetical protein